MKVLVVEDETIIGMDLVMLLEDWGYWAEGPAKTVSKGLKAVDTFAPHAAILDVNLGGGHTSAPIAKRLSEKNIPFLILTGYDEARSDVGEINPDAPHLRKPLDEHALRAALSKIAPKPGMADR